MLAWGHILAPKPVEESGGVLVLRLGLLDCLEDGFVRGCLAQPCYSSRAMTPAQPPAAAALTAPRAFREPR
jgi:hypothetical protein